ncbi:hypothetical protein C8R47DRAFT_1069856 [Mycena vitilis]|nr:hypothetical protein C8R47DRAFT_1069856 [Mycena vitilis]
MSASAQNDAIQDTRLSSYSAEVGGSGPPSSYWKCHVLRGAALGGFVSISAKLTTILPSYFLFSDDLTGRHNFQREIGVVNRHATRRVHIARIEGKKSEVTVAMYGGDVWLRETRRKCVFCVIGMPVELNLSYKLDQLYGVTLGTWPPTGYLFLGFPSIELETRIGLESWDNSVYAGLREFHKERVSIQIVKTLLGIWNTRCTRLSGRWKLRYNKRVTRQLSENYEDSSPRPPDEAVDRQSPHAQNLEVSLAQESFQGELDQKNPTNENVSRSAWAVDELTNRFNMSRVTRAAELIGILQYELLGHNATALPDRDSATRLEDFHFVFERSVGAHFIRCLHLAGRLYAAHHVKRVNIS